MSSLCGLTQSLLRLIEISKIRRSLALLGRHEHSVGAEKVWLSLDADMVVVFHAVVLDPPWMRVGAPAIALGHNPRARQGVVENGNLVSYDVRIVSVESIALLHDGLIVCVQRQSAGIEGARTFQVARLHFQYVVVAISRCIDPTADGDPKEGGIHIGRKVAPVGKYAAAVEHVEDQDVERLRRYDELHLAVAVGHARHPRRQAPGG